MTQATESMNEKDWKNAVSHVMKIKAEYWQGNRGNGGQAQRELF
jgi:hypothetical protein